MGEDEVRTRLSADPEATRKNMYQVRHYMDHLSAADLERRAKDILFNRELGAPADVLVNPPPTGWDSLWRDVVDEVYRRFGDSGGGQEFLEQIIKQFEADALTRPRLPDDQVAAFLDRASVDRDFLVRYSKRRYLEEFVSQGHVQIRPASMYKDPSLNPGVRDDELRLAIQPNPSETKLEVFGRNGQSKGRIEPIDSLLTMVAPTDYYVYCMSGLLSPDLFHDFGADSCVLIWDLKVFQERLLEGLNSRLPYPAWGGQIERVQYVDPLNTAFRQFHIYRAKHFRYAYQQEYRLVWCPAATTPVGALETIKLELGDMRDCCELLYL